ncbi:hypothetical protein KJ693_06810 [bacterium]|nr:hypothetical protein [bacterium]MBU1615012.1 hypothetical protein [bacterium]
MGEFIYAQSFIDLHKNSIDNSKDITKTFQQASDSINILKEKFSWTLMFVIAALVGTLTAITALPIILPIIWNILKWSWKILSQLKCFLFSFT